MRSALLLVVLMFALPAFAQTEEPKLFQMAPTVEAPASPGAKPAAPVVDAPAPAPSAVPAAQGPLGMLGGGKDEFLDITADESLEWHEKNSVYIARGNAIAKRGDMQVRADVLRAFNRKKPDGSSEVYRLVAAGKVEITTKTAKVHGDKGEYDIDEKKATLTGQDLRFESGDDVVTATEAFEYLESESKVIARGKTRAIREGRQVDADEMIAYLAPNKTGGQDIEKLEARGNVKIVTKEDAVSCQAAMYNLAKNTATLSGNVRITRGANQLRGDKVEANFKTGQSRLINTGTGRVSALIIGSGAKPGSKAKKTSGGIMPRVAP